MDIDGGSSFVADDVLIVILLLLPAKSLGRFKCVCKKWYNLIQNPNFIKNHFNRSNDQNRLLAIHSQDPGPPYPTYDDDISFTLLLDESLSVRRNIDNPLISDGSFYTVTRTILGPVNGLYFIHYFHDRTDSEGFIALWNPTTSEFRQLNLPSFELPFELTPDMYDGYGFESTDDVIRRSGNHYFGFGSTDDDFKLVCITSFSESESDSVVVSLYSLAHDCWRQIEFDTNVVNKIDQIRDSALLNGAYYWLVHYHHYHLILFDMRTEVFREVPLPAENLLYYENNLETYSRLDRMLVRNNSVVLYVTQRLSNEDYGSELIACIEMKEEGCWNKLFCFASSFSDTSAYPLGFWKDDEIIFRAANDAELFLYNIRSDETRNLGIEASFCVLDYKETLTSVKGGRWINSTPI